jgi:hypothetical protein
MELTTTTNVSGDGVMQGFMHAMCVRAGQRTIQPAPPVVEQASGVRGRVIAQIVRDAHESVQRAHRQPLVAGQKAKPVVEVPRRASGELFAVTVRGGER